MYMGHGPAHLNLMSFQHRPGVTAPGHHYIRPPLFLGERTRGVLKGTNTGIQMVNLLSPFFFWNLDPLS